MCVSVCVCVCVFGKDVLLVKTRINLKTERYVDTQVSRTKLTFSMKTSFPRAPYD